MSQVIFNIDSNIPTYEDLLHCADYVPKAVATYLKSWKNRSELNKTIVLKKTIRDEYSVSLAKFRHDLFLLKKEALISFKEDKDFIIIKFPEIK